MNAIPFRPPGFGELPRVAQVCACLLAAGAAALSFRLWPEWRHNPDLSHGLFMPLIFILLIQEARRQGGAFTSSTPLARAAVALLLGASLAGLVTAGLYAASVDWSHPLVNLALTASFVLVVGAGLVVFSHRGVRFIGLNWSAAVALLLWLLCTPIPPGTYSRLTMTLQLWVSEGVLRTLHILGIAAIRNGNIIHLANTTVGVEEACSGVRSLISCVFAGIFFSATLVRTPWSRAAIILLAAPLALLMNFIRSLALTLLSNRGIDISGAWHDVTGFAVLGVTAALLAGLAVVLGRRAGRSAPPSSAATEEGRTPRGQFLALLGALGVATVLVFVAIAHTRPSARGDAPVPDLLALLPDSPAGWTVTTSDNLYQFSETLKTEHLAQRTYRKRAADGSTTEVILYVAYWKQGQAPVSLVASHTPDACWPGSGWQNQPVPERHTSVAVDERILPLVEYRFFTYNQFPQHVWFWHLYDGQPLVFRDPYSAIELLRLAWNYGFRHDGDQFFVRVSSNRPWQTFATEPFLAEFFSRTKALGL